MTSINTYINIYALPQISATPNEEVITNILNDWQKQHYTDHMSIYSTLNSLATNLNLSPLQEQTNALFFSDVETFNNFLTLNNTDHEVFYKVGYNINKALIEGGYGISPVIISNYLNPVQSTASFDYGIVNNFLMHEYQIHRSFARYLNILLAKLQGQPIQPVGGS